MRINHAVHGKRKSTGVFELKLMTWLVLYFTRIDLAHFLDLLVRARIPSALSEFLGLERYCWGRSWVQIGGELGYQWGTHGRKVRLL
jgi:hypothetical protein